MTIPVVALHGWGLNRRVFDAFAPRLEREVITLDLPGHGLAIEPAAMQQAGWDIEAIATLLLDRMPPRAIVLGWSLGGTLALQLAAQAPARVAALVLIATTPRFAVATDWPHGADPLVLERFAAQLTKDWRRTVQEFLALQVRGDRDAITTLAALHAALTAHGECSKETLQRAVALLHAADLRGLLPRITQPALVIAGQYDRVVHPAASRDLATQLLNGEFLEIPRCGHAPFLSHEEIVASACNAFCAQLDREAA